MLIENQLERANHGHLGQLLTYAAGLRAVTGVWIAERFSKEYRATLDWLNEITDEKIRFFGLEIELWKIGESPPAPKFNIVSKPSGWSPETARVARDTARSATREMRMAYWGAFNKALDDAGGPVRGIKPQPDAWMAYGVGRGDFTVQARMAHTKHLIWTELNIRGRKAKAYFKLLEPQREEIERAAGFEMKWLEQPQWQNCRIEHSRDDVDPRDEKDWPRQHEWLARSLNAMHDAFSPRIRNLDPKICQTAKTNSNSPGTGTAAPATPSPPARDPPPDLPPEEGGRSQRGRAWDASPVSLPPGKRARPPSSLLPPGRGEVGRGVDRFASRERRRPAGPLCRRDAGAPGKRILSDKQDRGGRALTWCEGPRYSWSSDGTPSGTGRCEGSTGAPQAWTTWNGR